MKLSLAIALALALPNTLSAQTAPPASVSATTPVADEPTFVPPIVYPADAKAQRVTGRVDIEVSVDTTGKVTSVRVLAGPQALRQAAVDAYYQARYQPLFRNGVAVPATVDTSVNFALAEAAAAPAASFEKLFETLHNNCQQLAYQKAPDAMPTCRRAVEVAHTLPANDMLEMRATAYNDLVLLLIAKGKYAGTGSTQPNPDLPEAGTLANDAVTLVGGIGPHHAALATAYITRAEVRSLAGDLKGSVADCVVAEEVLNNLIADQAAPTEKKVDRTATLKTQLRDVYALHAVVLDREHRKKEASQIRATADNV